MFFEEFFVQGVCAILGTLLPFWLIISIKNKNTVQIIISSILVGLVLIFYAVWIAIAIYKKRKQQ